MALTVPTLAELNARGENAEVLFWVGCAGSFDDRAKRITKAIAKIDLVTIINMSTMLNMITMNFMNIMISSITFRRLKFVR